VLHAPARRCDSPCFRGVLSSHEAIETTCLWLAVGLISCISLTLSALVTQTTKWISVMLLTRHVIGSRPIEIRVNCRIKDCICRQSSRSSRRTSCSCRRAGHPSLQRYTLGNACLDQPRQKCRHRLPASCGCTARVIKASASQEPLQPCTLTRLAAATLAATLTMLHGEVHHLACHTATLLLPAAHCRQRATPAAKVKGPLQTFCAQTTAVLCAADRRRRQ
jgi:hypothetical protein